MRLKVDTRTGEVLLTIPPRASRKKAVEWASGHRAWIEEALDRIQPRTAVAPGSNLPYLGRPHLVDWRPDQTRAVECKGETISLGGPEDAVEQRLIRWLKMQAKAVLTEETQEFAVKAGVKVTHVGIGDPVSRWGSCSTSGTIRYSWRLILAPDWVRRATVAHEVAHRIHMNRGPQFHALVEELLGCDPLPARQWLRDEGASLHRIGSAKRA